VETTAYFVVAEALTNVGKYARASRASVGVRVVGETLEIEVLDDGVGGADASAGTGLRGLADRVSALRGALDVTSPPGRGTRIHARISLN
jgi:signal transduction histidine kinase